ncbi:MAG TPA: hypothetical protein VLT45_18430 [Kofleriaceae bacterium]|nr:hypothetical protein [Kofleriaceae bacterium]
MRLAIVAAPPLALVSALTLGLALRPHHAPAPPPPREAQFVVFDVVLASPPATCETAHALVVRGHVTGGASHVQLAGPVIYTDVATGPSGDFQLRVPVDGNVCDLLTQPTHYVFGEDVSYTITFE